ncbi:hypothetical protein C427_2213 [Paraglaciecola psychrophila 170]|uniref:Uncharacterized protein n=1 Tax=Paraglaciecola psychrophila 170 TaxID=1129794 RepID=K6Z0F1_9ALTE|nr:hypothetical protein C427_2213 [Paraglaciecola psychrophila 170]GAC38519.1 hypothetical protein GPSY_2908 [Paraglaciecola psychrophila 170]
MASPVCKFHEINRSLMASVKAPLDSLTATFTDPPSKL